MQNWDHLRYYLAVARAGTVSAAAHQLNVSHATVLRRIEQFEQEIGLKLFKRLQSGYQLSEAGEKLYAQACAIEDQTLLLERQFQGLDTQLAGKLCISQPENNVLDLYPIYAKFIQANPNIELEINATASLVNLNRQEADIALRFTDNPPPLLVGRKIAHIHIGIYAHQDYLQRINFKTKSKNSLQQLDWIVWNGRVGKEQTQVQLNWLHEKVQQPKVVMQTSSVADVVGAVRAGIGAGLIAHNVAQVHSELQLIKTTPLSKPMSLWILTHQDLRHVERVRCFMNFMTDALKDQR